MSLVLPLLPIWQLIGPLAVEVSIAVIIIGGLAWVVKSVLWRRALWQVCLAGLLILSVVEITGVVRPMLRHLWLKFESVQSDSGASRAGEFTSALQVSSAATPKFTPRPKNAEADENLLAEGQSALRAVAQSPPQEQAKTFPNANSVPMAARPLDGWSGSPSISTADGVLDRTIAWLGVIWLSGAALYSVWLMGCYAALLMMYRKRAALADAGLAGIVATFGEQLGIRRRVRVIESERLKTPVAFGMLRPTIGLPKGFTATFDLAQQKAMLGHELAHLALNDPVWQVLGKGVAALLWWHPLVWWSRRQWHVASECAADEASVLMTGGPDALAECLLRFGERITAFPALGRLGVSGDGFRSSLGRRVARLLAMRDEGLAAPKRAPQLLFQLAGPAALTTAIVCGAAWATPKIFATEEFNKGDTLMKTIHQSWQRSLFAVTVAAALGGKPHPALADDASKQEAGSETPPTSEPTAQTPNAPSDPAPNSQTRYRMSPEMLKRYGLRPTPTPVQAATPADDAKPQPAQAENTEEESEEAPRPMMDRALMMRYGLLRPGMTLPGTNPTVKQGNSPKGRQAVRAKLEEITLETVRLDGLPLSEVVKLLNDEATKRDPKKRGINFIINPSTREAGPAAIDPTTGAPLPQQTTDIGSAIIRVNLALKDVRLIDVLDVIKKVSEVPVRYSIEDYGVVFSSAPGQPIGQMMSRTFKVDAATLTQGLENVAGLFVNRNPSRSGTKSQQLTELLRQFLASAGVTIDSPNQVFYNDRTGILMIRVSDQEQDIVQAAIEMLSGESTSGEKVVSQAGKTLELSPELQRRHGLRPNAQ